MLGLHLSAPCRNPPDGSPNAHFPFVRLPTEIMQEIFLRCLPPGPPANAERIYHLPDLQGFTKKDAPLLLCQVCRLWRQAALSIPNLWMSLDVYVSTGQARPALPLVELWLARSGGLPLSLSLFQQNDSNANRVAAGEILDLYKSYIHRWCDIQFDLTGPRYSRQLTPQQSSAPMLKQFRMQTSYRVYEEDDKDLFGIFNNVPRLEKLHVSRIPGLSLLGASAFLIPWNQLVSLTLDYVPCVGTSHHVLEKCPRLTEATFKVDSIDSALADYNPVRHNLTSLNINIGHEQLGAFLGHVILPALQDIGIYVRGPLDQYGWPQAEFESFLKRSQCKPTQFEIHDTGMKFDEFAACLRNPHLQLLERIIVEDRRDWTWDPFITDLAVDLLTLPTFLDKLRPLPSSSTPSMNPNSPADAPGSTRSDDEDSDGPGVVGKTFLPNLESLTFAEVACGR
ncbi:hypothetical protein NLJ89_g6239 [Agrocybe chaxingu]|uniref:F-box domain-containing protein n=1 Tax=Agrocybe chaxingu TaxID=84603 RepID=A0A9W8JZ14_9AGAR|nr:hypothetical protein NLJ89_g6239 [Agrocybe chaxingu]